MSQEKARRARPLTPRRSGSCRGLNLASLFLAKSIDVSVRKNLFFTQCNYRVKMSGQNVLSDNRCLKLYNKEK